MIHTVIFLEQLGLLNAKPDAIFRHIYQENPNNVFYVLNPNNWRDFFPNIWSALRIQEILPVSTAKLLVN